MNILTNEFSRKLLTAGLLALSACALSAQTRLLQLIVEDDVDGDGTTSVNVTTKAQPPAPVAEAPEAPVVNDPDAPGYQAYQVDLAYQNYLNDSNRLSSGITEVPTPIYSGQWQSNDSTGVWRHLGGRFQSSLALYLRTSA